MVKHWMEEHIPYTKQDQPQQWALVRTTSQSPLMADAGKFAYMNPFYAQ